MIGPRASMERFALLAVDSVEYAVDAAWVRRSLPAPSPLPAAIRHGGVAYQVIDLRQLFGLPVSSGAPHQAGDGPGPERLILLIDQPPAGPAAVAAGTVHRVALVIDDLLGIEPLAAGAAVPLPGVYRGPERRWFQGVLPRADGGITVLLRPEGLPAATAPPPELEWLPPATPPPGGAGC